MSSIKTIMIVGIALSVSIAWAGNSDQTGTPESDIGLSKSLAHEVPTPEPTIVNASEPGDVPAAGAPFESGPPPISHGAADYLPITVDRNDCVDCHAVEEKLEGEATPIPASHFTDLRNAPDEVGTELIGARYICVACHVSPGGNDPLVDNDFGEN